MSQTGAFATQRGRARLLFWAILVLFAAEILFFAVT